MTKDKQRAIDLMGSGELPESSAGMSGAILILTEQEFELHPGARQSSESRLYTIRRRSRPPCRSSASLLSGSSAQPRASGSGPAMRSSSPPLNFAYAWAEAAIHSIEGEADGLERLSSGFGPAMLRPAYFEKQFELLKKSQRKDGYMPHSRSNRGGPLETSLFLIHACGHLQLRADKKLSKKWYPALRKAGEALRAAASKGLIITEPPARTDGGGGSARATRRVAQRGQPRCVPFAQRPRDARVLTGKGSDSAGFKEASVKIGRQR